MGRNWSSIPCWCHNLAVLAQTVVPICLKRRIHLLRSSFNANNVFCLTTEIPRFVQVFCSFYSSELVFRSSLHVLKHTFFSDLPVWGFHRWWTHSIQCIGVNRRQDELLDESLCWSTNKSRDWNLLWDRHEGEEIMLEHLLQVHAVFRICDKAFFDKVLSLLTHLHVVWEWVSYRLYLLVSHFYILWLKWRSSIKHCVQDYSNWPVINFITVATLSIKHLRCKIVGCPTNRLLFLTLVKYLCSKSKVTNF